MITQDTLDQINKRITELETSMSLPEVTADRKKFQALITEHAQQKKLQKVAEEFLVVQQGIEDATAMLEDAELDDDMREMAELEVAELAEQLPNAERALQIALLPPDPADSRNAILEIRAGTGGDEAALFAGDLFRMYQRYAESRDWTCSIMERNESEVGGYKEVIATVQGPEVFKVLKYESGVHRVQRIPATEAAGRIHTSAATVAVMPEADEVDEINIAPDEIRVDYYRSSGPGGQSVNTTDSAVRITHLETGIVVQCQDEKSQHRNKEKAMHVMQARLLDHMRQIEDAKRAGDRRSQIGSGDRSERIRTCNFPQNRVTDHRIGLTLYHLDRVMEGDLDQLIDPLTDADLADRLKAELENRAKSE